MSTYSFKFLEIPPTTYHPKMHFWMHLEFRSSVHLKSYLHLPSSHGHDKLNGKIWRSAFLNKDWDEARSETVNTVHFHYYSLATQFYMKCVPDRTSKQFSYTPKVFGISNKFCESYLGHVDRQACRKRWFPRANINVSRK